MLLRARRMGLDGWLIWVCLILIVTAGVTSYVKAGKPPKTFCAGGYLYFKTFESETRQVIGENGGGVRCQ